MNLNRFPNLKCRTLVNDNITSVSMENDSWKFVDSKGSASLDESIESTCEQDDMISSLSFSPDGKYLAVGDYGGRVIIFRYRENKKNPVDSQYKSLLGLTSHTAEFDKLRSVVVAPTVEHLLWLNHSCNSHVFITANSSTIKLWKIKEGYRRKQSKRSLRMSAIKSIDDLKFPDFKRKHDYSPTLLAQYPSLYGSPINGVSVSYDDQYFLVSDSTSIGMFNVEKCEPRYELFRLEEGFEDNNEVISTMSFLPFNSSIFCYGTSHGNVNVCDLRLKSYCDQSVFSYKNIFASKNIYHSSYNEIHCIRVLNDTQMLTRDFMSLCHWDLRMTQRPIEILNVNNHIRYKLWDLIESDSIFHRFQIATSPCAKYFVTGGYNNQFNLLEKKQSDVYNHNVIRCDTANHPNNTIINRNASDQKFNRVVNSYIYNERSTNSSDVGGGGDRSATTVNDSSKNIFPINPESFHDLESYCPKRKLGSGGCITEKSFDLLDRQVKTYNFAPVIKRFNFEAGTIQDKKLLSSISSYFNDRNNRQWNNTNVLVDISDRKLNKTTSSVVLPHQVDDVADAAAVDNKNAASNKSFYPVSFDPYSVHDDIDGYHPSIRNKISQVGWHPNKNLFVVATQFNLYFYEHSPRNHGNNNNISSDNPTTTS